MTARAPKTKTKTKVRTATLNRDASCGELDYQDESGTPKFVVSPTAVRLSKGMKVELISPPTIALDRQQQSILVVCIRHNMGAVLLHDSWVPLAYLDYSA